MAQHAVETEADELVRMARSGDLGALDALMTAHLPLVYGIVSRAMDRDADVDDVVQDVMLRAVLGLGSLRDPDRFRSWLVAITVRQIRDRWRSRARHPLAVPLHDLGERSLPVEPDVGEVVSTRLSATTLAREVEAAARWLDADDRELLLLWWQETGGELTRADLARALGISSRHAGVRIQRMRGQLDLSRQIVLALDARPACRDLLTAVEPWNGRPSPLWRKRIARHLRSCGRCTPVAARATSARDLARSALVTVPPVVVAGVAAAVGSATPAATPALAPVAFLLDATHRVHHLGSALLAKPVAVGAAVTVTLGVSSGVYVTQLDPPPREPGRPAVTAPASSATSAAPGSARRSTPAAVAVDPPATAVGSEPVIVAPDGDDATGTGTASRPFGSLARALRDVGSGDTVLLRGGVYRPTSTVLATVDGTAGRPVTVREYPGEKPVVDGSRLPVGDWLLHLRVQHWLVSGLELTGTRGKALVCTSCAEVTLQNLNVHDNLDTGIVLTGSGTHDNRVVGNDVHGNHDDATRGQNADGITLKYGSGSGNVVTGNRVWANADDGIDLFGFTDAVTVRSNWSWGNGVNRWGVAGWEGNGNGFKLGGDNPAPTASHLVEDNAAWDNTTSGFTDGSNPAALVVRHNTAFRNGGAGFYLQDAAARVSANVSVEDGAPVVLGPGVAAEKNSWQLPPDWTAADFAGTAEAAVMAPRPGIGRLPTVSFLYVVRGRGAGSPVAGASMGHG